MDIIPDILVNVLVVCLSIFLSYRLTINIKRIIRENRDDMSTFDNTRQEHKFRNSYVSKRIEFKINTGIKCSFLYLITNIKK